MKTRFAVVLATCVLAVSSLFAGSRVVISQVYGGGGNAGATLKNDFIELHNRGAVAVVINGWSVQYASSAGTTWQVTGLTGTIPANGYYLIQESAGTGGTVTLPAPVGRPYRAGTTYLVRARAWRPDGISAWSEPASIVYDTRRGWSPSGARSSRLERAAVSTPVR